MVIEIYREPRVRSRFTDRLGETRMEDTRMDERIGPLPRFGVLTAPVIRTRGRLESTLTGANYHWEQQEALPHYTAPVRPYVDLLWEDPILFTGRWHGEFPRDPAKYGHWLGVGGTRVDVPWAISSPSRPIDVTGRDFREEALERFFSRAWCPWVRIVPEIEFSAAECRTTAEEIDLLEPMLRRPHRPVDAGDGIEIYFCGNTTLRAGYRWVVFPSPNSRIWVVSVTHGTHPIRVDKDENEVFLVKRRESMF